jgi:FtsZ-interacting cell division protein ZipA
MQDSDFGTILILMIAVCIILIAALWTPDNHE